MVSNDSSGIFRNEVYGFYCSGLPIKVFINVLNCVLPSTLPLNIVFPKVWRGTYDFIMCVENCSLKNCSFLIEKCACILRKLV